MGVFNNLLLACLLMPLLHAYVVINSQDYMDVASAIFYANANGDVNYLIFPGDDYTLSLMQIGNRGSILLVESPGKPVFAGFRGALEAEGNRVELISSTGTQLNLELARKSGVRNFIITDSVYGHNIVSLVAYAKSTHAYLIFANKSNVGEVASFLSSNRPDSVMLYGILDEEVVNAVEGLGVGTETINNGDKYEDNIEIVDRYLSSNPELKDVLLSDGNVLEVSINTGDVPVVLVSTVIPDSTYNFMLENARDGRISAATLIGSTNLDPVYDMTKKVNTQLVDKRLRVLVKFGQGATGGSGEVQPLSTFPLPSPFAAVSLDSAAYNPASGAFELVYSNKGNAQAFVKSSIQVLLNGQQVGTIGDDERYAIRRGESKGVRYLFENPGEGQLSINDTTYYGVSMLSFDKAFLKYMDVGRISFVDQSSMALSDASYSPLEDKLAVKVRNNGTSEVFYRISVSYINDEGITVYDEEQVRNISAGRNEILSLGGVLKLPMDKADKTRMNVTAAYGAREAFLEKRAHADVIIEGFPWWILLILLMILLALAYWYYKRRKGQGTSAKSSQ